MSDKKISELTPLTTPDDADLVPVVDTSETETKHSTWANIKATLKTYFDTLYAAFEDHKVSHQDGGNDEISVAGLSGQLADEQDPLDHKDDHNPSGGDPLDTAAAANLDGVQAGAEGSAESFSRSDHAHRIQHSILNNAIATIDDADAADNDYAKFTASGLEGREYAEVIADLSLEIGVDVLAQQTIGIADDNLLEVDGSPNANEYARFTANGLEGRTEAEFKADYNLQIGTDVLAQQTIGIADNNLLEVDDAAAADNQFARFTANGIEGRSVAQTKADLSLEDADINALIVATKLDDLATPDDNTDLDATTSEHGLLRKLDNVATNYLSGVGTWSVPSGAGGGAEIKVGTYTGDGTSSQAITGVGFEPLYLKCVLHPTGSGGRQVIIFEKWNRSWSDRAVAHANSAGNEHYENDDWIIAFGADGFTVDDPGSTGHPNGDGLVYDYMAIG